jgi:hypothetical protein
MKNARRKETTKKTKTCVWIIYRCMLIVIGWEWRGLDWSGSGYGQVKSSCECGNEPSGFHKMLGNYRVATQLMEVVLSSTELLSYLMPVLFRKLLLCVLGRSLSASSDPTVVCCLLQSARLMLIYDDNYWKSCKNIYMSCFSGLEQDPAIKLFL